jgi:hypothetical protein
VRGDHRAGLTAFTVGVSASAKDAAAKSLLKFLTTLAAVQVFNARGLDPTSGPILRLFCLSHKAYNHAGRSKASNGGGDDDT